MDKIHLYDKILFPVVTEKSTNLSELNKITFKVPDGANKNNLKKNIEKIFKVNVTKINIINKQNRTKITRGKKVKVSGYKKAIITLKKDVLDPQGKVIHQTLDGMGFNDVNEVRQGKYFEIDTKESNPNKAKEKVEEMCKKLLANLVIENYKIIDAQ